jgi:hypothetical protein
MNTPANRKPPSGTATPEADPAAASPIPPAGAAPFSDASPEARKLAAAILEVLAGAQTPGEAAWTLGLSLARYYQLEMRAMAGLVAACEDRRRKGRGHGGGQELAALRRECEQLRRLCARQQALARATRRTVGLTPPAPPTPASGTGKRRKRRPTARALKMAALLQPDGGDPSPTPSPVLAATESASESSRPEW